MEQKNKRRMVKYVLPDTNVLVYALKGIGPYAGFLANLIKRRRLYISVIVIAEFLSGAMRSEEISLKLLTDKFEVLPVDTAIAEIAADYKKGYSKKIKKVWLSDCLIAATCKAHGALLATANKKDYPMKDIEVVTNF